MTEFYDALSADAADLFAKAAALVMKDNYEEALSAATEAAKTKDPNAQAAAQRVLCLINLVKGAGADALAAAQEAVGASTKNKYTVGEAAGLCLVARAQVLLKKEAEAVTAAEEALKKFEGASQAGEAFALCTVAKAYVLAGRNQKAFESANKALGIFKDITDLKGEAVALSTLFETYMAMKKYSDALQATEKMFDTFTGLADTFGQGLAKALSAEVNAANDCKQDAVTDAQEASKLFKKVGANGKMGAVNKLGAEAAIAELMADDAKEMAERAALCFKMAGDKFGQAAAQITMANYYSKAGEFDKATYRAEAAAESYKKLGDMGLAAAAMRTACFGFLDRKMYEPNAPSSCVREAMRTATTSLKLYEGIGDQESVGYASSVNALAQAHLAAGDLDLALEKANESQELFKKLDYPIGTAATLNTIAQVNQKKGDTFEAVSVAKEAQQLFQENDDDEGAEFSAYLIDLFQAPPEAEAGEEPEEKAPEKKKTGPSVCQLGDMIPGGAAAVKPVAAYDAYEGRAATAPGQRRQASGAVVEAAAMKEEAVFSVRWVSAKNLAPSAEVGSDKSAASRVIKRGMVSSGPAGGTIMPSRYAGGMPVF
mmetsp:Transcript_21231/g.49418  ORF Transcript_21231/g.49418 Transcript_21231/m.49418 type:complete len:600 (-) Transcript_21231:99-1898(-)|eukprot:CAMPEP_0171105564 /NCGR_PEP_ID=MMETSP0766_2-20121228/62968_1 /TAXON_ID=439317 /ORGANISM="Gambierdiscus australes, Strain CAWD 149" /LENGTH=599 /DNA_ID=CAMNT_0011566455 /DNA_START=50 /DNA_END=1849 /DNA_ORIENTATION=+